MADAAQLAQVFTNLVGNALKYRRPDVPPDVRISAERTGQFWRFAVEDNGIGIEAEYFDRIFVIFQRLHTRDEYEGTGIGLAVVRKIVERHGGTDRGRVDAGRGLDLLLHPAGRVERWLSGERRRTQGRRRCRTTLQRSPGGAPGRPRSHGAASDGARHLRWPPPERRPLRVPPAFRSRSSQNHFGIFIVS